MTILAQVYSGYVVDDPLIPCIEVASDAFLEPIRNCGGFSSVTVNLEDGTEAYFWASGLDVALPSRDDSGQQNLTFAIDNVTGAAQLAIDTALEAGSEVALIYREYLASDLTAPARKPIRMSVLGSTFSLGTVRVTASYRDMLNYAWPREKYTNDFAPGLRDI